MSGLLPASLLTQAEHLLTRCKASGTMLALAESCTGGLISAALTSIPGSSAVVDRAFVTYSNDAKTALLDVPSEQIAQFGAVSEEIACAMAEGALTHARADLSIAVTGIAGPDGGTAVKPVGTVHFATAVRGGPTRHHHAIFPGDRDAVRLAASLTALELLLERLDH